MTTTIIPLLYTFQAAFSGYNLYLASISIFNLREYEDKAEKAAEWSSAAEDRLRRTRATKASGTGALILTLLTSTSLLLQPLLSTSSPCLPAFPLTTIAISALNIVVLTAAYKHVSAFWKHKAKIPLPGVGDYNEAIDRTDSERRGLGYLAMSWGIVLLLDGMRLVGIWWAKEERGGRL